MRETHFACPHAPIESDLVRFAFAGYIRVVTFADKSGRFDRIVDTMEVIEFGRVKVHRVVISKHAIPPPELLLHNGDSHAEVQDRP
jgi:hypothetical protein